VNHIILQIVSSIVGIGIGCLLVAIIASLSNRKQNKYSRIIELQRHLDMVGYSNDKEAVNELGILLHGKKEWNRRKECMGKINNLFKDWKYI
jgi:hypothetical protein